MTPRGFDRFMVAVEIASNGKVARFNDAEFRCLISGFWALAAKAEPRGMLTVGGHPAISKDVAHQGRCSVRLAQRTWDKMVKFGMLDYDETHNCYAIHDWDGINPPPKTDRTNADRQRRFRALRNGVSNGPDNGGVTPTHARTRASTSTSVVGSSSVEALEENDKEVTRSARRADVTECFEYWRERCKHPQAKLTREREQKVMARFAENYTVLDVRLGIDGAATNPPRDRDSGVVHDDLVSICRNGAQLERYMGRASSTVPAQVVPMRRPSAGDLIAKLRAAEEAS